MERYEEKEVKCLISKPRGLWLARRRRSLRRAGVENKEIDIMRKYILLFLTITFLSVSDGSGQNINSIRGTSWISLDYIRDMENYLPCECSDSINYYSFISIAPKLVADDTMEEQYIPEGVLNYIIQTEPTQFYILDSDSTKYIISGDSKKRNFELTLNGDTLFLIDGISSNKFIKSVIPFDFWEDKYSVYSENITLFNKSLSLRGYPTIQKILKEDSLRMDCNAWLGNRNIIYSRDKRKSWVLEINNGYLYIEKIINPNRDPLDAIKTKVIKKLKWVTNGKERLSRKKEYPVWTSPK